MKKRDKELIQEVIKIMNANEEVLPICDSCNETVEDVNDDGLCEQCYQEAGQAREEAINDLD